MALASIGTKETQAVYFNYGFITINGKYTADIENVSLSKSFENKSRYSLNSIKIRNQRRSNLSFEVTFSVKADTTEIKKLFYSSSSVVSGTETVYSVLDGQQVNTDSWLLTVYEDDAKTKARQIELIRPLVLSMNDTMASQEYVSTEITTAVEDIIERQVL
jgi:hypothetical protein